MISVLLVDDHELIRQGLRRAFERDGDFEVVGEAATVADARRLLGMSTPDVMILDVRLPDGNGLEATRKFRADNPELGI
ncbi:MAG TPA: response regulator transcription factor, partial [Candidatus Nanopelagicales bacterium]